MSHEWKLSEFGRKIVEALPDRVKVKRILLAHKRAEAKARSLREEKP